MVQEENMKLTHSFNISSQKIVSRSTLPTFPNPKLIMLEIFFSVSFRFPLNQGIAGHVATTGETLNVEDVTLDTRFNANVDQQVKILVFAFRRFFRLQSY